jgi:hypothetical protein
VKDAKLLDEKDNILSFDYGKIIVLGKAGATGRINCNYIPMYVSTECYNGKKNW